MRTIKKKVYKFSERSRMNQSKAAKNRWDAMTPEEQAAHMAKMQAARQQKRLEKMIDEWGTEDTATVELGDIEMPKPRSLEVARKPETAAVEPAAPTPMQKNLEILRVRVGERVGFEVNTEQAIEFLVNKWGVRGL